MKFDVHDSSVSKVGSVDLPDAVFGAPVKKALLWEQVKAQLASRRRGTHKTKNRAEVSGTGAKPFKQKGTGRARQGSERSPQFVGGGTTMTPRPRDYSYRLPRSARRQALRSALSLRVKESALVVLDKFDIDKPKTKEIVSFLGKVGSDSALIVDTKNEGLKLSTRNLRKSKFVQADALNVYDIMNHDKLVLTKASLEDIVRKAGVKSEQPS